jgi:nucleotide-binding universal stress UspA family protein
MYHHLLVTHDGSDVADAAVAHAIALALAGNADVLLLRVADSPALAIAGLGAQGWRERMEDGTLATAGAEAAREEHDEAEESLASLRMRFLAAGVAAVDTLVVEGEPGPKIVEAAAAHERDLIVMATHGRSGVQRALLGSVADYVVRHQRGCPVVLCCPETEDPA